VKHLLTLQEGVSPGQMAEMRTAGVKRVVPAALHRRFGKEGRGETLAVEAFVRETGWVCG
jgi:hypothetical protein